MPYLEACVAETLRLHNPVSAVGRIAAQDYTIGDTGITVPKGMLVNFSIQSMHRNPDYYPEPDRWNPERFMPYNRDKLVPYTYMPFGLGPRNCVGMRFALMETKTATAYLVNRFKFIRTPKTTVPLVQTKLTKYRRCLCRL
ncbi:cytochrome P450 3A19-like [Oppia nitens]|uniref:cytochrome P450 3A19-like n=1 Tax=Oppia nitens TaxID=1686743 RepID=UPI0023DC8B1D|nr:cytochrome P450 3A19-like [Oppia nitens]